MSLRDSLDLIKAVNPEGGYAVLENEIMGERAADQTDEKELGLLMAGITDTETEHSVAEVEANLARAGGDASKEV